LETKVARKKIINREKKRKRLKEDNTKKYEGI